MGLTDTVDYVINTAGVTALLASRSNIVAATTVERVFTHGKRIHLSID